MRSRYRVSEETTQSSNQQKNDVSVGGKWDRSRSHLAGFNELFRLQARAGMSEWPFPRRRQPIAASAIGHGLRPPHTPNSSHVVRGGDGKMERREQKSETRKEEKKKDK